MPLKQFPNSFRARARARARKMIREFSKDERIRKKVSQDRVFKKNRARARARARKYRKNLGHGHETKKSACRKKVTILSFYAIFCVRNN